MDGNDPQHDTNKNSSNNFPPVGKGVFVRNQSRDRMAYRDAEGCWRDYYNGDILEGEVIYHHYD